MRRDIGVSQDVRFEFEVLQSLLYDVAAADDAGESAIVNDKQMPRAVMRHEAHRMFYAVTRSNGHQAMRKRALDRHGQRVLAVSCDRIHDIAFGQYADDPVILLHDTCSDV